jgi:hypothetical protein
MADEARRAGVAQLWAGNYGALTPSIHSHFDHVFTSFSEQELAGLLGFTIDEIQHPPLVTEFRLPGGWSLPVGVLFSSRGCRFRCTFCQATAFAPRPKDVGLESIDRVVRFYVQHGVHFVLMLDEHFGNLPASSEEVIKLLARHKVRWLVQSRVDLFVRNFEKWRQCGMEGAPFGIESFHQDILKQMHKTLVPVHGPLRVRWAAQHRLPFLPTPALSPARTAVPVQVRSASACVRAPHILERESAVLEFA